MCSLCCNHLYLPPFPKQDTTLLIYRNLWVFCYLHFSGYILQIILQMLWPASLGPFNVVWSQLSNMHLTLYYFPAILITQHNQGNLKNRVNFGIWFQADNHHDNKWQVWQEHQGTERLHLQLQPREHEAESVNWRCSEALNSQNPIEVTYFPPYKVAPSPKRVLPTGTKCSNTGGSGRHFSFKPSQLLTFLCGCVCVYEKNGQFQMSKYSLLFLNATVSHTVDSGFLSHGTDFCN